MEADIAGEVERIGQIYCDDVLAGENREVQLVGRKCQPQILYTFLGYELKIGRRRLTCPDIATARYLTVFAQVGMPSVRIPYDPTKTAVLLEGLEPALHRIHDLLLQKGLTRSQYQRAVRRVYARIKQRCNCAAEQDSPA